MPFRSFFLFCILKTVASYLTLKFSPCFLCTLLSFVKYREMKFDLSTLIERFQKTRFPIFASSECILNFFAFPNSSAIHAHDKMTSLNSLNSRLTNHLA